MNDDLKAREESKRERCWDPAERMRIIQATIDWVDSQQPVPRNSPEGCRIAERIQIARLEATNKKANPETFASGLAQ